MILNIDIDYRINGTNFIMIHYLIMVVFLCIVRFRSGETKIFLLIISAGRTKVQDLFPDKGMSSYALKRSLGSYKMLVQERLFNSFVYLC